MIYKVETDLREKLAPMFTHIESTILLSYLQGHMGSAWVDDLHTPAVAQITVGIFVFYTGNPDTEGAKELLHNLSDFTLAIVGSEEWKTLIEEAHKGSIEKFQRYTFIKAENYLNRTELKKHLDALTAEFVLKKLTQP